MSPIRTARLEDGGYLVDLRGWICPYPKYVLDPLLTKLPEAARRLVFLVDCPSAATDVPRLAQDRGHRVPEVTQMGDGEWRITIEVSPAHRGQGQP